MWSMTLFTDFLRAQTYTPVVDDRVNDALNVDTDPLADPERRGGWEIKAAASATHDSNIFLSNTDAEADEVIRVGPQVGYTQGDAKEGPGGFVRFAYEPVAVFYLKHDSNNRVDQRADLTAGWRGQGYAVTYAGAARQLGDATAETARPTERVELENEVRAAWEPREKVTLEVSAGNKATAYDSRALYDSSETYGRAAIRYAYSPKTEVGVAYQAGQLRVEDGGDQFLQQVTAEIAWQPRQKIRVLLRAGGELRKADDGNRTNPVMEGRIEWDAREGTKLYLAGYQRQEASSYYAGQDYNVLAGAVGISQRLGGAWTARLDVGAGKTRYDRVSGSAPADREDVIWFIRPALEYQLSEALDVSLFYQHSRNKSTAVDFGYRQDLIGVEVVYQF